MEDVVIKVVEAKSDALFEEQLSKLVVLYNNLDYNIDIQYHPCHSAIGNLVTNWNTYYSALFIARRIKNEK